MPQTYRVFLLATALLFGSVLSDQITCDLNNKCPEATPCCSQYGYCGVGAYCLGNCDPLSSYQLGSCLPSAVCKDADYSFTSLSDAADISDYLGDYSSVNWVYSGNPLVYDDSSILLTLAQDTVGTLLGSTHYVWYGKICATMTTSQGKGVVTAFIMMSDVKDEIDFEFVGYDVQNTQTNYFPQGITIENSEETLGVSDTESTAHEYCIDWQQDTLSWEVDGDVIRTLKRSDTWNSTSNRFEYPQSPSRIMLSLWPAGLSSNANGTVEWAGGLIDWSSEYMQNGYYYAMVKDVSIKCYDPPSGYINSGSKSYVYTDYSANNNTIEINDEVITLASFYATGDDPDYDPSASTKSAATSSSTAVVQTIPGQSNTGDTSSDDGTDADTTSSASSSQATSTSSSSSSSFSQGGSSSSSAEANINTLGSSILAAWVGLLALLFL